MKSILALSVALVAPLLANGVPLDSRQASNTVNTKSMDGLFLFGYQGFFRRPRVGVNDHWMIVSGETPGPSTPGDVQFDMFPAVDAYPSECLFDTNFILPDGSKAQLFESNCTGVVDVHFQWMQENGIDGILVQRFYNDVVNNDESFIQLLSMIRTSAEKYGRGFAVEYDLSQITPSTSDTTTVLFNDYENVVRPLMDSPSYLQHQGRPVIELWGFGIDTTNGPTAAQCQDIFTTLRSANPNPYVIMGVQQAWRADKNNNPDYYNVYLQADVIQPWTVGSYDNSNYDGFFSGTTVPDKQLTDSLGINYSPVVWPGGSDRNRGATAQGEQPLGNRWNGTFYTDQLNSVVGLKPQFIFGAMFDEYPEGTQAIATLRFDEVPPASNPGFLGIDNAFDHNQYLEFAGAAAEQFHQAWAS